jgi:DNA-binding winged helix-turn-helix (wHTH) protein
MGAAIAFYTVFSLAPMLVIVITVAGTRKALADGKGANRFIANIPGRGYSFVAPVRRAQGQDTPPHWRTRPPPLATISPHS